MTEVTDLGSQIAPTHENSSYIYNKIKLAMQTVNNHNWKCRKQDTRTGQNLSSVASLEF